METLYFILGGLSVVAIAAVVSLFKIKREMSEMVDDRLDEAVNRLSNYIEIVERNIDGAEALIDKKEDELIRYTDQLHSKHEDDLNELYRYIDSRTDKMADGISKHIAEINQQLAGK